MIMKIVKKWNINLNKSFMIGDSKTDKMAAKKSNMYFEYVKKDFCKQIKNIDSQIINNY